MNRNPWTRIKRQELCDGWGSFCLLSDPLGAWESVCSPERLAVDEPILGGISAIVAPFVYLADVGTSDSLGAELDALRTSADILRRRGPGPLHDPERLEETARRIEVELPRLERMRHAAATAEKLLVKHGWKFDSATGKARRAAKHKGGELLVRLIQRLGVEGKHGDTPAGRAAIKRTLSPVFPDLDAGPRGAIARALQNLERMTMPSAR